MVELFTQAADLQQYDSWIRSHPDGTLWQSLEWKIYQEALGREVRIYVLCEGKQILASALVVIDRTTFGFSVWDIPRGPLQDSGRRTKDLGILLEFITKDARHYGCISVYWSPSQHVPSPKSQVPSPSRRHEQPEATRIIDLTKTEEDILKQMRPKGRYNISIAEKHGVVVRESTDIDTFTRLTQETAIRDGFSPPPASQLQTILKTLPGAFLLLAYPPLHPPTPSSLGGRGAVVQAKNGSPPPPGEGLGERGAIAGLLGIIWQNRAIYYYGASSYSFRALMAPYLLQWKAMCLCRARGCTSYDLLGIAPAESGEGHPWQGVSAFKEKFGGTVMTYPPEQEIILRPLMKTLLRWKRKLF
ncbi:MAG: peptidoglycan bridge formation glycyltransferase FemA/FemB family protein [Candidatus Peregrinibacteria bacterium]